MDVISRKEAQARELVHFYTGLPCKHGHDSARYTGSGACVKCMNDRVKAYNDKFRRVVRGAALPQSSARAVQFLFEVPLDATPEQRVEFAKYVQHQCAPVFFKSLGLEYGPSKTVKSPE